MGMQAIKALLGLNNNNNGFDSSQVAANADGSALERLEFLQAAVQGSVGLATFPAAAAAANGVSLAEVLRYIQETLLFATPQIATKQHTSPLTTGNIFTFTGAIEIMAIWGRVTTVIQTQTTNVKLSVVNDALAAYDICANVDATAAAVGTLLSITGTAAGAGILTANGVLAPTQANRIITQCGTSGVIKATYGAASTGAIKYGVLWRPLSSDAALVAA